MFASNENPDAGNNDRDEEDKRLADRQQSEPSGSDSPGEIAEWEPVPRLRRFHFLDRGLEGTD